MTDDYIVPVYVVIDDLLRAMNYQDDSRSSTTAAEVLTIGVVAAKYFHNHHERAVCLMRQLGHIKGLSVSRFNRRFHGLLDWFWQLTQVLGELLAHCTVFIIHTTPCVS